MNKCTPDSLWPTRPNTAAQTSHKGTHTHVQVGVPAHCGFQWEESRKVYPYSWQEFYKSLAKIRIGWVNNEWNEIDAQFRRIWHFTCTYACAYGCAYTFAISTLQIGTNVWCESRLFGAKMWQVHLYYCVRSKTLLRGKNLAEADH